MSITLYSRYDTRVKNPKPKIPISKFKKLKDDIVLKKVKEYINSCNEDYILEEKIVKELRIRKSQVSKAIFILKTKGQLREINNLPEEKYHPGKHTAGWKPTIYKIIKKL